MIGDSPVGVDIFEVWNKQISRGPSDQGKPSGSCLGEKPVLEPAGSPAADPHLRLQALSGVLVQEMEASSLHRTPAAGKPPLAAPMGTILLGPHG